MYKTQCNFITKMLSKPKLLIEKKFILVSSKQCFYLSYSIYKTKRKKKEKNKKKYPYLCKKNRENMDIFFIKPPAPKFSNQP